MNRFSIGLPRNGALVKDSDSEQSYTCAKGHTGEPFFGTDGFRRCRECRRLYTSTYKRGRTDIHARNRTLKRFGGIREAIIQRDGEKCVKCGMGRDKHRERYGRDITVNHIDGNGRYSSVQNNDPTNLETLCVSCHSTKDNLRRKRGKTN